jgi:hypothetical protein
MITVKTLNPIVKETTHRMSDEEFENLKSQFVISSWGGMRRAKPYAFTEQGVAMFTPLNQHVLCAHSRLNGVCFRRLMIYGLLIFNRGDRIHSQGKAKSLRQRDKKLNCMTNLGFIRA